MIYHVILQAVLEPAPHPVTRTLLLPEPILLEELSQVLDLCFRWTPGHSEFVSEAIPAVRFTKHAVAPDGKRSPYNLSKREKAFSMGKVTLDVLLSQEGMFYYYQETYRLGRVSFHILQGDEALPQRHPEIRLLDWEGELRVAGAPDEEGLERLLPSLEERIFSERKRREFLTDRLLSESFQEELDEPEEDSEAEQRELLEDILDNLDEVFPGVTNAKAKKIRAEIERIRKLSKQTLSLRECLEKENVSVLRELARHSGFCGISRLRKAELVEYLVQHMLDPDFLRGRLSAMALPELDLLEQLAESNLLALSPEVEYMSRNPRWNGLCYLHPKDGILYMPVEFHKPLLEALQDKDFLRRAKKFTDLHMCCLMGTYLYGVCPLSQLRRLALRLRGDESGLELADETYLLEQLYCGGDRRWEYVFDGEQVIHRILSARLIGEGASAQSISESLAVQESQDDYYLPDREDFPVLLSQPFLFTPGMGEFWNTVEPCLKTEGNLQEEMSVLELCIRGGENFQGIWEWIEGRLEIPDEETLNRVLQALQDFWNDTPMWKNSGYSPNQKAARLREQQKAKPSKKAKKAKKSPKSKKTQTEQKKQGTQEPRDTGEKIISLQERRQKGKKR